jgi:integrase
VELQREKGVVGQRGSTRKRGSTWTAYWRAVDPATNETVQQSKGGFRRQSDANKYLNTVVKQVDDGTYRRDTDMTIRELLVDHWLPAKESEGVRPATVSLYRHAANGWLLPHVGGLDVRQLAPAKVSALVETLKVAGSTQGRGGLSARSVQIAITVLKAATGWAAASPTGLIARDPLAGYKRPRAQQTPMNAWSTDEARRFLAATSGDRLAFAWSLFLTRGLRRGELCGLRWDEVDLDGRVIRIVRTRVVVDGKSVESLPKTAAGRRSVPLDPALVSVLRRHKAVQAAEQLAATESAYEDGGWLVADELGRPLYPDTVSERFDELVKKAKLRRIRLHDTRHTAASLMLASGVAVKVVADLLGHDPKVTLATYAHVIPGMGEQAGAALSAALLG